MLTLRENEAIIKVVRQHRSVLAGTIIWSAVFVGLALFTFLKLNNDILDYSGEITTGIALLATLLILYKIYIWRKSNLILTNQRVILNVRHGAFSRTVTELLYKDVHDISFRQVGLSALIYRYGKLIIKMPSGNEITFDKLPLSAGVIETINKIRAGGLFG